MNLLNVRNLETTTPGFRAELVRMAQRLDLLPDPIAAVIAIESGFNAQARNPSGAVGLIQFMPATAKGLGTSTEELLGMNATAQLEYVEKFLKRTKLRLGSPPGDYYMAVFMPALVGMPNETVIASAGDAVYRQNKGLDFDRDGVLRVADVKNVLDAEIRRAQGVPPLEVDPLHQLTPHELEQEVRAAARFSPQAQRSLSPGGSLEPRHLGGPGVEITPEMLYERIAGLGAEHEAFRTHVERLEAVARRLERRADWETSIEQRIARLEQHAGLVTQ